MAVRLSSKSSGAIQLYSWKPDLIDGDGIAGYALTPTGVTIEAEQQSCDEIQFFVAGGTAGQVHSIAASVDTSFGEALRETIYIPIFGPGNSFATTAEDIITFALQPIVGLGGTPTANEKADALGWLNGLLPFWSYQGADVGQALPIGLTDVIYAPDEHVLAIKTNMRVYVAEQYGRQTSQATTFMAQRGLQMIKQSNLPDIREQAEYF